MLYHILASQRASAHLLFSDCHCFRGVAKQHLLALRFEIRFGNLEINGILKERCF